MALIVEDGTGRADAESYATVAEADAYWSARGNETWGDLDLEVKEIALRKAAAFMVSQYRGAWAGYRKTATQALDWPRQYVFVNDVYPPQPLATDIVPEAVKRACIELAFRATSADLAPDRERQPVDEMVGPIRVIYDRDAPQQTQYVAVEAMLSPLLTGGATTARIVR